MPKALVDSIKEIIERADESLGNQETDYEKGRLIAFAEVLSILKADMVGNEEVEKLLDFDIDRKYT